MNLVHKLLKQQTELLRYKINTDNIQIFVTKDVLTKCEIHNVTDTLEYEITFKIVNKRYCVYLETIYDMRRLIYKVADMPTLFYNCFKALNFVLKNKLVDISQLVNDMRSSNDVKSLCDREEDVLTKCVLCKKYLSSQQWGPMLESFIKKKFNLSNKEDSVSGDGKIDNKNIEIKVSLGVNKDNESTFNFVQIRPDHNIDYYLFLVYVLEEGDLGTVYWFLVESKDLYELIPEFGGYSHGTIEKQGRITQENMFGKNYEYSLRPKVGNMLWNRLLKFRKTEEELVSIFNK